MATDVAEIKRAAAGRWPELLCRLGGIDRALLDGRHHGCPKCGGTDRFRAFDDFAETGGVHCNQCHAEKNSDGVSTLQWSMGVDFGTAIKLLADDLGISNGHLGNDRGKRNLADSLKQVELVADAASDGVMRCYSSAKPPVTPEGIQRCGGVAVRWNGHVCIRVDGREPIDAKNPKAVVLVRNNGQPFPAVGKLGERKTHTLGGSSNSWLVCGDVATAKTIIDLEGVTDLLAAASAGLPNGWAAVTNTAGAKARVKLARPWAKNKRIIVAGDADQPGVDGQQRAAAAYVEAGATEVLLGRLPYDVEPDHGRDLRDWLLEGGKTKELPTVTVTAEEAAAWKKPTRKNSSDVEVTNFYVVTAGDEEERVPLTMQGIIDHANRLTGEWPRRVDTALFVDDRQHGIGWLHKPADLFGFYQRRAGRVRWGAGDAMVKQGEVFAEMARTSRRYAAVEVMPHEPPMSDHYYSHEPVAPGDGKVLRQLLDRFCPSTDVDRDLVLAALLTCFWGGPLGARPSFVVTSNAGRGAGKTTLAEMVGDVAGGCLSFSHLEDIGKIKTRILSPTALTRRVCLLDNIKTPKFSWAELEAMVTATSIGGHQLYVGESVRPNTLTWFVTLNGASLSTDMAQRSVIIQIDKPPRSATWQEDTRAFIEVNRKAIVGDIVGALRGPITFPLAKFTRWASWERDILQRLPEPSDAQAVIVERQGDVDADGEEAAIIGDFFAEQLASFDYSPDTEKVFIPSQTAARWYGWATGQKTLTVSAASRALKQLVTEGRLDQMAINKCNAWGKGFIWVGQNAEFATSVAVDLKQRIFDRKRDA